VVAVLKAVLMLGDSCSNADAKSRNNDESQDHDIIRTLLSSLDDADMGMPGAPGATNATGKSGMECAGLAEYARHTLREMCSQPWVREKFLKDPDSLCTSDVLLDNMLSPKQAQQLVQMICWPDAGLSSNPSFLDDEDEDEVEENERKHNITRILRSMDQWSLRVSWLEMQLLLKQTNASQMTSLLDTMAKATIGVFQSAAEKNREDGGGLLRAGQYASEQLSSKSISGWEGIWLIAPLIAKLPATVQGRVLKVAGQVLETGNSFWSAKSAKDKQKNLQESTSLLGLAPFLSLVLTCLKGQDEQREGLLNSLHNQLDKFVVNAKEPDLGLPEDHHIKTMLEEALQLRLSLVGGMFDTIQRSPSMITDWCVLLASLIVHGVVDTHSNRELFTIILDMLSVLIHGTLVPDKDEEDDGRKNYGQIMRKLKKELGDKKSIGNDQLRKLLPIPKKQVEVITVDPHGTRGHKSADEKKHGLQVSTKQKLTAWDLLDGHKNPAPLTWAWFGAVRLERKPLIYEDQHRLLLYHSHNLTHPASYYLDPPPLPPEDLEPPPEKQQPQPTAPMEEKAPPEPVVDAAIKLDPNKQQPKVEPAKGPGGRKKPQRKARTQVTPYMGTLNPTSIPYRQDPLYQSQPGGWGYQAPQPQPHYGYSQTLQPGSRQGFGSQSSTNSKIALSTMLRARQPNQAGYYSHGGMPGTQSGMPATNMQLLQQQQRQQQHMRQQMIMRQQSMMSRMNERPGPGMYGSHPGPPSGPPFSQISQSGMSSSMGGNYGGYSGMSQGGGQPGTGGAMMEATSAQQPGMMAGGGQYGASTPTQYAQSQTSIPVGSGPGPIGGMQPGTATAVPQYGQQPPQHYSSASQFNTSGGITSMESMPNYQSTPQPSQYSLQQQQQRAAYAMQQSGGRSAGSMLGMPGTAPHSAAGSAGPGMAGPGGSMGGPGGSMGGPGGSMGGQSQQQQQTAALVAQLQRSLTGQPGQPGQPPQYSQYSQHSQPPQY